MEKMFTGVIAVASLLLTAVTIWETHERTLLLRKERMRPDPPIEQEPKDKKKWFPWGSK